MCNFQANSKAFNPFRARWQCINFNKRLSNFPLLLNCCWLLHQADYFIKAQRDNIILILLCHETISSWITDNCQINMSRLVAFITQKHLFASSNWSFSLSLARIFNRFFVHLTKFTASFCY